MSSSQYWRTGVYSTSSAPGLIIAHGMCCLLLFIVVYCLLLFIVYCCLLLYICTGVTGAKLNDSNVNLFISRDGGVSWNMVIN